MSRPRLLDRQTVTDAAFARARTYGFDALTARGVAEQLHCSTQAVYTAYGSMDRLRADVRERAEEWVLGRLGAAGGRLPYLELGVETLRLARDEPHLFQLASHVMRSGLWAGAGEHLRAAMRHDPRLANADDATLDAAHDVLTLLVLGLADTLDPEDPASFETAVARLTTAGAWVADGIQVGAS